MPDAYEEFLLAKVDFDRSYGFPVDAGEVHPALKPHQADIVRWCVAGGRRAVFANFGLGKTPMQLEVMRLLGQHRPGPRLIVCPLGVRQEFTAMATGLLDMDAPRFVRRTEEVDGDGLYLTNYESIRDGRLTPGLFDAVSLDEASVLRSYGSKTYQSFLGLFDRVPFRFVATATPAPNRYKELIHYAGFLGVMDTGQALTRWFKRDSTKANNLTLHPHKVEEFHLWLNTWAVFLQRPSDLGYPDDGYVLPGNRIEWREVAADHSAAGVERDGQVRMFRAGDIGVSDAAREKRATLPARLAAARAQLEAWGAPRYLRRHGHHPAWDQVVIWVDLNDEQRAVEKMLDELGLSYSSIYGSLDPDEAERRIFEWKDHHTYALVGKPVMLGQGLNLQQANKAIFLGVTFKFNDVIQASHRIHRFGQRRECHQVLIHAESERSVVQVLRQKWRQHEELAAQMSDVIKSHGLDRESIAAALARAVGVERIEVAGDGWCFANNDTVPETRSMATGSVDLIVTSIPFANHYEYTPSANDFGHTDDNGHFWAQMDFLTPELLRVLAPGRLYCCHVKDRILFGNVTGEGVPTVSPFHAEAIAHGIKHGFQYMGMVTVVTDVVRENNQSYRLTYSEMVKDATKMGVGSPEYVLLFRKPQTDRSRGYADVPVVHDREKYSLARWQVDAHAFWRSDGNRDLTPEELLALPIGERAKLFTAWTEAHVYDYEAHLRIGEVLDERGVLPKTWMGIAPASWHPDVWHDVQRMRTLNSEQARKDQEQHVCPLQFDIVDRLIERYSNPGDLVYDPFGGLGTVVVRALKAGRRGRAVELNPGYFADGVRYCQAAEAEARAPSLFDLLIEEAQAS